MTMANSGISVKNLLEVSRIVNVDTGQFSDQFTGNDRIMICNPIPASNENQLLQVNIQGGGNLGKFCFFKNVVRQI